MKLQDILSKTRKFSVTSVVISSRATVLYLNFGDSSQYYAQQTRVYFLHARNMHYRTHVHRHEGVPLLQIRQLHLRNRDGPT